MSYSSEEKLLGGLTHVLVLFQWLGLVVNIVLFLVYKDKSGFVARHAKQALGLQIGALVAGMVLGTLAGGSVMGLAFGFHGGAFPMAALAGFGLLFGLLGLTLFLSILVLAILGAIKGFQGQEWRYPLIGEWVESL